MFEHAARCVIIATVGIATAAPGIELPTPSQQPNPIVDFETQVIPVLTKAGCNSGSCHGAAIGRGGFKLSLLGYDPQADYDSLVSEFEGRRVNQVRPEKSLVLRKPALDIDHEGGLRLKPGGDGFRIVRDWIAAGAPRGGDRRLLKIEVAPTTQWLPDLGGQFSIKVLAHFATGDQRSAVSIQQTSEDVTRWAVFTATDPAATRVDSSGAVTVLRRGQTSVMVRFLGEVAAVTVMVPINEGGDAPANRPLANFVDEHVNRTLDALRLPHSPRTDDRIFVRRVYLDLIGVLPDPAEVDAFVADRAADKRQRLVEGLLDRSEFADLWALKWGDLLRIESRRLQPEGAAAFHSYIRDCVAKNTPLDVMARTMLLATGDGYAVGPANFSRVPRDAREAAEHVSRVMLGVRLQCANCHNHPLDRWTQDDYHGLAAVFARVDRSREVKLVARGDVIHPRTGRPAVPRIPGDRFIESPDATTWRDQFADWATSPVNPFFARVAVNRIWRELMGRGLVEPVDDLRATNPATHPELLDALAADLASHRFDVRHTVRTVVTSEAYQRSSVSQSGNRADDRFCSKALVRPLAAHVLIDAVVKVTGVTERLGDLPGGTPAISLGDSRVASEPLDLLGRCSRDAECSAATASSGSLPLALHTINGPWLNAKLADPAGRLARLLTTSADNAAIVTEFYLIALSRRPTQAELNHWHDGLAAADSSGRVAALQDFCWALLNSAEFGCNH